MSEMIARLENNLNKSFKARQASQQIYFPYLFKEYRNRWFLVARVKNGGVLMTLALDRFVAFQELTREKFIAYSGVDFGRYFSDLLGVTKSDRDRAHKVILFLG